MEKLIHQYLDENYFPYKEKDIYKIYHNDSIFDGLMVEKQVHLVGYLKDIYGLEYEEVKLIVYTWGVQKFPDFDLSEYWEEFDKWEIYWNHQPDNSTSDFTSVTFPMVQRVMARTIGLDMVRVQPMSAPKGVLFYMDYKYEPKLTFKQKVNSVLDKMKIFIRKMEKDIRKYLHITNYNATFVTQEK